MKQHAFDWSYNTLAHRYTCISMMYEMYAYLAAEHLDLLHLPEAAQQCHQIRLRWQAKDASNQSQHFAHVRFQVQQRDSFRNLKP